MKIKWLTCLLTVTLFFILHSNVCNAQCDNVDFENGTFSGWQGTTGTCCPINLPGNGIVVGRQTIIGAGGYDVNTCNNVPLVSPTGGNISARLGNPINGAQAEGLSYTFTVTASSALFTYQYAVVFQDPGHAPADQPRFATRVLDASGNVIPCTEYFVTAASNLPGFQTCNSFATPVVYRNWTTVGVDLTAYIGQTVTVQFETGDCNLGGHYGYAYIDGLSCQPMEVTVLYCVGDSSAVLTAPEGFATYQWSTGDTTRIITVDPAVYPQVVCTITTFSGCVINLTTNLTPADPIPNFSVSNNCLNIPTVFTNQSTSTHSPIFSYSWNFGDGATDTATNPIHTYLNPGTYTVTLIVVTEQGCTDTVSNTVTIYPLPIVQMNCPSVCLGQSALLTASGATTYSWTPATWLSATSGSMVISTPLNNITYTVTGTDSNGCVSSAQCTVIVNTIQPLLPIQHN